MTVWEAWFMSLRQRLLKVNNVGGEDDENESGDKWVYLREWHKNGISVGEGLLMGKMMPEEKEIKNTCENNF